MYIKHSFKGERITLTTLLFLILILLFSLSTAQVHSQSISRVEPPNWWVGMKNSTLQLLVYGEDIAHLEPAINYQGVEIKSTVRLQNPNYLFLYLEISEQAAAGSFTLKLRNSDTGQMAAEHSYELRDRSQSPAEREGFNPTDVIYLITPDRFANGNPDNDAVEGLQEKPDRSHKFGRHGGDIQGILENLDYIEEMGFTAIWLNPVLENDMPRSSYHGYATTDFYQIDRRFGTNEEYLELSKTAHDRGIKLIMDMILNHCGSEHWFVKDPPSKDWINFDGNYVQTNHRHNTVQDPHASEYDRMHFTEGWFGGSMPDLNQENPYLADYLVQNTIWWIEFAGLAGIRMDTYPYSNKEFMNRWTCAVMQEYPDFNIVGEEWNNSPAIVSYWQRGKKNRDGYTSCLPSLMDFPVQAAMANALVNQEKRYGSGLIELYNKISHDFLYPDPYNMTIFTDNHDMDRLYTQVGEDVALQKMAFAFVLTSRGIPQIYYGTEILMDNTGHPGDHGIIRTEFPGGWEDHKVNAFTGKGLRPEQIEAQNYLRELLVWRQNSSPIHSGRLMQFIPEDGIYVYFRYHPSKEEQKLAKKEKVMVILNKNEEDQSLKLARFAEMLEGTTSGKDPITGKQYAMDSESIQVPGKSATILEIE